MSTILNILLIITLIVWSIINHNKTKLKIELLEKERTISRLKYLMYWKEQLHLAETNYYKATNDQEKKYIVSRIKTISIEIREIENLIESSGVIINKI